MLTVLRTLIGILVIIFIITPITLACVIGHALYTLITNSIIVIGWMVLCLYMMLTNDDLPSI